MAYGILKCDTVTFTDAGVDKSVTLSGLVQNPTFSGNVTVTGTLSGVTVTGTTANFTSGNFTNISGGTHTITSGVFAAGSAASPSITFTGNLNTGIYSPGADQVAISTGGSGRLFVDASGGISTSSTAWQGGAAYQAGGLQIGGSTYAKAILQTNGTIRSEWFFDNADTYLQAKAGIFYITNTTANPIGFYTNGSERLRITSAGLVGIGTSSPNQVLDVRGNAQVGQTGENFFNIRSSSGNGQFLFFSESGVADRWLMGSTAGSGDLIFRSAAYNFSTGSERLRITSAGLVGIGTNSPSFLIHGLKSSAGTVARFEANGTDSNISVKTSGREGIIGADTSQSYLLNTDAFPWTFWTNNIQRMTITSAGLVGIGTSSPSGRLTIANDSALNEIEFTGNDYTNVYSSTTQGFDIGISNGSSTGPLRLLTANTERLRITSAGNVGIGTTSPGQALSVAGNISSSAVGTNYVASSSQGVTTSYLITDTSGGNIQVDGAWPIRFTTNSNERARIDSSGRLLVGTSSAFGVNHLQIQGDSGGASGTGGISLRRNVAPSGMGEGAVEGVIDFGPNDGGVGARIAAVADAQQGTNNYPSRLVLSTTADGASSPTERMRISNQGQITNFSGSATDCMSLGSAASAGTTYMLLQGVYGRTSLGNGGAESFRVYTNGNVQNTNNSYGAISDIKLKENIVDATPQWNDIKALQVRKYNFKEGQTHTQIGLVAQEVELVSPGLVSESPDRDEDGNDLGTVTKSVNYSVLYMKAVKALQEAMERIETLEAKVAALETK